MPACRHNSSDCWRGPKAAYLHTEAPVDTDVAGIVHPGNTAGQKGQEIKTVVDKRATGVCCRVNAMRNTSMHTSHTVRLATTVNSSSTAARRQLPGSEHDRDTYRNMSMRSGSHRRSSTVQYSGFLASTGFKLRSTSSTACINSSWWGSLPLTLAMTLCRDENRMQHTRNRRKSRAATISSRLAESSKHRNQQQQNIHVYIMHIDVQQACGDVPRWLHDRSSEKKQQPWRSVCAETHLDKG